jgi:predicted NAD/FAD-binding protein
MSEPISLFRITGIFERTDITEKGTFAKYYEVKFVTKSGIESSVLIPKAKYTKEKAIKEVEKLARQIEETLETRV